MVRHSWYVIVVQEYYVTLQILMEYVGGGSVSNHMRSSNAVPVNLDVSHTYVSTYIIFLYVCTHFSDATTVHKTIT